MVYIFRGTTFTSIAGECWLAADDRLDLIVSDQALTPTTGTYEYYDQRNGIGPTPLGTIGIAANGVALKQGAKTLVYTTGTKMFDVMADLGNVNVDGIGNTGSSTYFKLPSSDGSSGQALITDASGQLSFSTAGISTGKAIAMAIVFG